MATDYLYTFQVRQAQVQDNHIGDLGGKQDQPLVPGFGFDELIALNFQRGP
jgi:hypothetical protein